jgi:hypothetical protein
MTDDESSPLPYQATRDARAERLASGRRTATTWVVLVVVWILGLISWTAWIGAVGIAILAVFSR